MITSMIPDHDVLRDAASAMGLLVSLFLLFIHIKNRKTQHRTFLMARDAHYSGGIDVSFVGSQQLDGHVLLHIVLFNPSSTAALIKSVQTYRREAHPVPVLRWLGVRKWVPVAESVWWPTDEPDDRATKDYAQAYKHLLVKEQRDILINYPGHIDRDLYAFEVKTNRGEAWHTTTVDSISKGFPFAYRESLPD